MTDKKTRKKIKKEINAVIQKYLGKFNDRTTLKTVGILGGVTTGLGIGMDLLLTGGIFSMGTFVLGSMGTIMATAGGGSLWIRSKKKSRTNAAGQNFQCVEQINDTLEIMELHLRESFNTAALIYASQDDKGAFRLLAAEIEQDVKKLSPAFTIVSGGPHGFGTNRYEFIVAKFTAPDGQKKQLTLAEALQDPHLAPLPKKQAESVKPAKLKKPASGEDTRRLKARLEAIEKLNNPPRP